MIVKELVARLGFTTDQTSLARAEAGFRRLRSSLLQVTAIAAGIGGAIFATAKSAAAYADSVVKASQKTGLATDAYQRLAYNASLANVEQEKLQMSLIFLSRQMGDAAGGSKQAIEALKDAGITLADLKKPGFTAETAMEMVADKAKSLGEGFQRTAMLSKVLGARTGPALASMMIDGAEGMRTLSKEAEELGLVFGEAALKQGPRFNDNMQRITKVVGAFKNMIGLELIPVISDVMDEFLAWVKVNRELIKAKAKQWGEGLVKVFKALLSAVKVVVGMLESLCDVFGGVENTAKLAAIAIGLIYAGRTLYGLGELSRGLVGVVKSLAMVKSGAVAGEMALNAMAGVKLGAILVALKLIYDTIQSVRLGEGVGLAGWLRDVYKWADKSETVLAKIVNWVYRLTGMKAWVKIGGWLMDKSGLTDAYVESKLPKIVEAYKDDERLGNGLKNAQAITGAKPVMGGATSNVQNNDIDNHFKIEVNVETGADPNDIANTLLEKIDEAMGSSQRRSVQAVPALGG